MRKFTLTIIIASLVISAGLVVLNIYQQKKADTYSSQNIAMVFKVEKGNAINL